MILKASERGGASQLALHLLKTEENEHVELHELRGFVAEDLPGALHEAYAVSRGTRCRKFLFSLSLSPPADQDVPVEVFEAAIARIEAKLGLDQHPRAIVFHEKEGRRHAHAVWSRIDAAKMTAQPLPHFKRKLNSIARELYIEQGWRLPKGFLHSQGRDPLSFTRDEWQQAKRARQDPRALKALFQECWAASDSRSAFQNVLRERGYYLARGDRRGFVALDYRGEVYSLSRYLDVKPKALKKRLGDPEALQGVDEVKAWLAEQVDQTLRRHAFQLENKQERQFGILETKRQAMAKAHRETRSELRGQQKERWQAEERKRAERLPRGFKAAWYWLTGQTREIRRQNEIEIKAAEARDRDQRNKLISSQLTERRRLQAKIKAMRDKHAREIADLHADVAHYLAMGGRRIADLTNTFENRRDPIRRRDQDPDRTYEPDS